MKAARVASCLVVGVCVACAPSDQGVGDRASSPTAAVRRGSAQSFRIKSRLVLPTSETVDLDIDYVGKYAVVLAEDGAFDTVFDLEAMSWRDFATGTTVTLQEAEARAAAMASGTLTQLGADPASGSADLAQALLDPNLQVTETPQTLVLQNDVLRYTVSVDRDVDPGIARRIYAFERLNAYHKAMRPGQLPPFAQLAVVRAMEERSVLPQAIEIVVTTPDGPQTLTADFELEPLEESAVEQLRKNLIANGMSR